MINTKEIQALAQAAGACSEGVNKVLESGTPEELISLYKEKIDFCLSENFPSNEYLTENVDADLLAKNGIYLNKSAELENADFLVLLGDCKIDLEVNQYSVSQVFVKNESTANILTEGNSFVVIDCFDNSKVIVNAFGNSKVLVNIYGDAGVQMNEFESAYVKIDRKNRIRY